MVLLARNRSACLPNQLFVERTIYQTTQIIVTVSTETVELLFRLNENYFFYYGKRNLDIQI